MDRPLSARLLAAHDELVLSVVWLDFGGLSSVGFWGFGVSVDYSTGFCMLKYAVADLSGDGSAVGGADERTVPLRAPCWGDGGITYRWRLVCMLVSGHLDQ